MVGVENSMNELIECINMAVGYPLELLVLYVLCVLHACVAIVLGVYQVYCARKFDDDLFVLRGERKQ